MLRGKTTTSQYASNNDAAIMEKSVKTIMANLLEKNNKLDREILEATTRKEVKAAMAAEKMITAKGVDEVESKIYGKVIFNMHYNSAKTKAMGVKNDLAKDIPKFEPLTLVNSARRGPNKEKGVPASIDISHDEQVKNAYRVENSRQAGLSIPKPNSLVGTPAIFDAPATSAIYRRSKNVSHSYNNSNMKSLISSTYAMNFN